MTNPPLRRDSRTGEPAGARTSGTYASVAPSPDRPVSSSTPTVDIELDGRRVEEMFARLRTYEDHYSVLGVEKDASAEAIRARFFRLSRVWHPDRTPPALEEMRDKVHRVYARIVLAYRTLTDPTRRVTYDRTRSVPPPRDRRTSSTSYSIARPSAAPPKATTREDKSVVMQRVLFLATRNELLKAGEAVRNALVHYHDDGELLALQAYVASLEPSYVSDARVARRVMEMFDEAIVHAPVAAQIYVYRGLANKRRAMPQAALRDFKMALELEPENTDAAREMRIFRMRRQSGASAVEALKPQEGRHDSVGRLFAALTNRGKK